MRLAIVVLALVLASCGQDSDESRIKGQWQSTATGQAVNWIDFTISQDENAVTGIGDVKGAIYEFDGSWTGSFGSNDVLELDLELSDFEGEVSGTGTLSTGEDAEDAQVEVAGTRTGRSFQFSLNSAAGDTLQVSGHFDYDLKGIVLTVEVHGIPASRPGDGRDLRMTVHGKRSGGLLNLFPSQ